jgi:hypothetical protein
VIKAYRYRMTPDNGASDQAAGAAVPPPDAPGGSQAIDAEVTDGPVTDSPATDGPELHPLLAGLRFLIGRWEGAGVVGYPTMESAQFGQELVFRHNGKPYLAYASRTWLLEDDGRIGRPLAEEAGFWRPQADGGLEVVLAHASGISEIYYGQITGTKIEMATDAVVRTATAQDVTAGQRLYGLIGTDLGYAYDLAASGQPLQAHTSAQLKRVSFAG